MEAKEREQLSHFLQQLVQARAGAKDGDAEGLIREAVGQQPDAPYLLVQRALLLDQALRNSQATVARLQAELDQARGQRGFLADGNAWGQTAPTATPSVPPPAAWQPAAQQAAAPQVAAPASSWGGGSFLGSVATTAAGVVAGSFLFQGLENLMGHHTPSWGNASAPVQPLAGETGNNFLDTPADGGAGDLDSLTLDGDSPDDWSA